MGIQRVRQYQRLEVTDDLKSWAEKHLKDHAAEASLRIQDFDHNRLANLHQAVTTTDSPTFAGLTMTGLTASKPVFTSAAKALTSSGTLATDQGGTGLTAIGTANQVLAVNGGGTALEYQTLSCVAPTRSISTTTPLAGGGNLSADRTLTLAGLSTLGTANYILGANSGATAWEYKQLVASTNIGITHAAGSVTIGATLGVGCSAYLNSAQQNLTDDTWTAVSLDAEDYDVGNNFDTGTHVFTAPVSGYYYMAFQIGYQNIIASSKYMGQIQKNSATTIIMDMRESGDEANISGVKRISVGGTGIKYLAANDTIRVLAYVDCGANTVDLLPYNYLTFMDIMLIG
jgi:hypothetical protein